MTRGAAETVKSARQDSRLLPGACASQCLPSGAVKRKEKGETETEEGDPDTDTLPASGSPGKGTHRQTEGKQEKKRRGDEARK